MSGSQQYHLNYFRQAKENSPVQHEQLQENLERLSNLMANKPLQVKTVYVQMHGYLRSPSMHQTPQTRASPASKLRSSGQTYFDKTNEKLSGTQNFTQRKSFHNISSDQLNNSNYNGNQKSRNYNSWVGLSVIERNKIFLEKKQKKLKEKVEQKEAEELSQCTFVPAFFNPIRIERHKSCQANKSYQDIYQNKKLHNSRLYY